MAQIDATIDPRQSECCGHIFQTITQRRRHEAKRARGERLRCPCGDECYEGDEESEIDR